jgi:hypothetical protein
VACQAKYSYWCAPGDFVELMLDVGVDLRAIEQQALARRVRRAPGGAIPAAAADVLARASPRSALIIRSWSQTWMPGATGVAGHAPFIGDTGPTGRASRSMEGRVVGRVTCFMLTQARFGVPSVVSWKPLGVRYETDPATTPSGVGRPSFSVTAEEERFAYSLHPI